jgi:hypothetical protein
VGHSRGFDKACVQAYTLGYDTRLENARATRAWQAMMMSRTVRSRIWQGTGSSLANSVPAKKFVGYFHFFCKQKHQHDTFRKSSQKEFDQ